MFGEKDYQQLRVVTQMARDLNLSPRVVGLKTVRERDGLALSSRNVYLSERERETAPVLYRVLRASAKLIKAGDPIGAVLKAGRAEIAQAGFALDYLEARHALSLEPMTSRQQGPIRLLVAAKIGRTRLIDNIGV
jgi:pantoate--beta-alanine ligase